MAFNKFLSIVAIVASVLLLDQAPKADACSCIAQARELCDFIEAADVVLRATAKTRSEQTDINEQVTYTILTTSLFKGEPNVRYAQEITFITGGNSALCGVELQLEEEYLLGLYRSGANIFDPDQEGQLTVGLCDLVQVWSDVSMEDLATLEAGCDNADLCFGSCGDSQECMVDDVTGEYYCADVCSPDSCGDEEVCSLEDVQCVTTPCPPVVTCTDFCGGCNQSQECMLYDATGEFYCADVCIPSTCGDEETCSLEVVQCITAPCPPIAVCTDPCGGCDESQDCVQYQRNGKFYCSDNCDHSPCGEYEQCTTKVRKWCRHSGFDGCPSRRSCH